MLREHNSAFRKLIIFADICVVVNAFFLICLWGGKFYHVNTLEIYLNILPLFVSIWIIFLWRFGIYDSIRMKTIPDILQGVFKVTVFGFITFSSLTFILKMHHISRLMFALIFLLAGIFIGAEKIALVLFSNYIRKKGYNYRNLLIVGTNKRAQKLITLINSDQGMGFHIVGLVDADKEKKGQWIANYEVLGSFEDIPYIVQNNVVDEIIFVVPRSWLGKIEEALFFCESQGLRINLAVDHFELKFSKAKQRILHDFPLLTFETTPDGLWHFSIKRCLDAAFSAAGLFLSLPVFAWTAIIIKVTSNGPVFFKQKRCGLNGRLFTLYKFRTMVEGAEDKLCELAGKNEMKGPVFKIENDPRLTKTGRVLRKLSIDELPQLWNVFKGDMSLVGPRPPLPNEVSKYDNWHRRRLSMKPGITCLWQIKGRNKIIDFDEWVKLDLEYVDNWSLWLDIKILIRTVPTVLFGVGAA